MRAIGLLTTILIAFGCAGAPPPTLGDDTNDPPPKVKEPPTPKDGSNTANGCDGITERGVCKDGVAENCEIDGDTGVLRRKDCRALGKNCIEDQDRGAICEAVAGSGPDTGTACGSVTAEGECDGDTAIWCSENTIKRWECGNTIDSGGNPLACTIITEDDELFAEFGFLGSWCESTSPAMPPPPPSTNCPGPTATSGIGFEGQCTGADTTGDGVGDTVVWCDGTNYTTEHTYQCPSGKQCEERPGNAWCFTPPTQAPSECETIGFKGVCQDNDTVKYCQNAATNTFAFEECAPFGQVCKVLNGTALCQNP